MTTRTTRLARVAGPAAVLAGSAALTLGVIPTAAGAATHAPHRRDPTAYYGYTGGVQTFTVPAGVYSVTINAVGAAGGSTDSGVNTGGAGASAFSTVSVTPGQTLYVYVGGVGGNGSGSGGAGGFNGGGAGGGTGAGGGGASDVRTVLGDLGSRVVVAAGGGGAGSDGTCAASGGNGGAQATNGQDGATCAGVATAGTGGVAGPTATAGTNGTPGATVAATNGTSGQGGTGGIQSDYAEADGGGGGGGVTGGGGGGAGGYDATTTNAAGGAGGGGGSSLGTSLGSSTAAASVTISYGTPTPPPPPANRADLAITLTHLGTFRTHTSRQYEMRVINTSNYNTSRTTYVTLTVPNGMKVTFGGKGTYWQCRKDHYFSVCNRRAIIYAHTSTTIKARVYIWAPAGSYRTAKAVVSPTDATPGDNVDFNTAKIYKH